MKYSSKTMSEINELIKNDNKYLYFELNDTIFSELLNFNDYNFKKILYFGKNVGLTYNINNLLDEKINSIDNKLRSLNWKTIRNKFQLESKGHEENEYEAMLENKLYFKDTKLNLEVFFNKYFNYLKSKIMIAYKENIDNEKKEQKKFSKKVLWLLGLNDADYKLVEMEYRKDLLLEKIDEEKEKRLLFLKKEERKYFYPEKIISLNERFYLLPKENGVVSNKYMLICKVDKIDISINKDYNVNIIDYKYILKIEKIIKEDDVSVNIDQPIILKSKLGYMSEDTDFPLSIKNYIYFTEIRKAKKYLRKWIKSKTKEANDSLNLLEKLKITSQESDK